ncbi:unnamed protein product (macronuclear) [Paramecium tetraurelia]|uniref:Anaphase-promoting complex subunit 4 WD40 domain-containing protein n=1 Tax=Paramecium tetraurelia TaxID=5888 RepID=A0EIM4_PARTE|nr:uncharacterized protein GSPATT00027494001 [Paramecium tetraurelia]CAK95165.1 unnamed protein product [Paramecium tetraurelia]|eukprot:XP_001462538.1 hypothetical protein (macronuclear) [Paramecium tetraurelia strain d4-2]
MELAVSKNSIRSFCFLQIVNLSSCSSKNDILLWNVKTGKIKLIKKQYHDITSVNFTPFGTLASSIECFVYLWNGKTGKQLKIFVGHQNSVCFSPDGIKHQCLRVSVYGILRQEYKNVNFRVKIDQSSSLRMELYQQEMNFKHYHVMGCQDRIIIDQNDSDTTQCFSPDCSILATSKMMENYTLMGCQESFIKAKLDVHTHVIIRSVSLLMVLHQYHGVRVTRSDLGCQDRQQNFKFDGSKIQSQNIGFSPNGMTLAFSSFYKSICLWDFKTALKKIKLVFFSPDGKTLASVKITPSIYGIKGITIKSQIRWSFKFSSLSLFLFQWYQISIRQRGILLFVNGLSRQLDKNKIRQLQIKPHGQPVSPLIVLNQHLAVMITLSVYGMLIQKSKIRQSYQFNLVRKLLSRWYYIRFWQQKQVYQISLTFFISRSFISSKI